MRKAFINIICGATLGCVLPPVNTIPFWVGMVILATLIVNNDTD